MTERIGLGTSFQRESATQGVYDTIAQVAAITPPGTETDDVAIEDLNLEDGFKRHLPGLVDASEVSLTLNFDSANTGHVNLLTDAQSRAIKNFKIVLPDTSTWAFSGYVKSFAPDEISPGDIIQAKVTIQLTSKPTFTAA